ncbi:MAG: endonuclease/exonuclease/phosphatase family protein [Myxococcota bacterium]
MPSILTWNVAGLHEERLDERSEASCLAALLRDPPEFLVLQELVRRSWHAHWKHHLHHAGFVVTPPDPTASTSEYFVAVAVHRSVGPVEGGRAPFAGSRMGRELVWATAGGWLVCTAHLESERGGSAERVAQAGAVCARLLAWPGPAVFGGDTNLRVEEEPLVPDLAQVTDAWTAAGSPAAEAQTWGFGGRARARFDRVWCNPRARPGRFTRVGVDPVPGVGRLSDHAGVRVALEPVPA